MATCLSVNLNKIALLRNSRGRDFPSVLEFAQRTVSLGVKGITIHPRPDERHIRRQDARDLAAWIDTLEGGVELNIEGYPDDAFIELIQETKPHQVTLVPDGEHQLTSDHGWDLVKNVQTLAKACQKLRPFAGRLAVFVDPDAPLTPVKGLCDRVELYTEAYAKAFDQGRGQEALAVYKNTAAKAQALGLGVNAGHDLDLNNLGTFLSIPNVLEVSIGHALTVEALHHGWESVVKQYLGVCDVAGSNHNKSC